MSKKPTREVVVAPTRHEQILRRMLTAIVAMVFVALSGGVAYDLLGRGRWTFADCLYMAIITISTVGFAELSQLASVPYARAVTVGLVLSGIGVIAFFQANLTALLVEGSLREVFRRYRMRKQIGALKGHVVVAGAGATGRHVIDELVVTGRRFVVIERNKEHIERLSEELMDGKMLIVYGDATNDHALLEAGVDRASGVVAALTEDKDNVFVTLSARSLNPNARIVSKVMEEETVPKLLKAGANRVVSPTMIGGRRLAGELLRPEVTELLDQLLRDKDKNLRMEDVVIADGSSLAGVALKDSAIRTESKALIIAVRGPDGVFSFNPDPTLVVQPGWTLIAIGEPVGIRKLRVMAGQEIDERASIADA